MVKKLRISKDLVVVIQKKLSTKFQFRFHNKIKLLGLNNIILDLMQL
jgi:hypothetical protein